MIMDKKLIQLVDRIQNVNNMDLSMFNEEFLKKTIKNRLQVVKLETLENYCEFLNKNNAESQLLLNSLQIHYSEFFRDPLSFAILEKIILPGLIQKKIANKRKEIRVWSAGCSGGQEPYSIAILLEELLANNDNKLRYRIFATDIDEKQLEEGRRGEYNLRTLGNVNLNRISTWFTKRGENYVVLPSIQEKIDFSCADLIKEGKNSPPSSIFGEFDLVFCCNVLVYYQPFYQSRILKKFEYSLAQDGYLITDTSEKSILVDYGYSEVFPQTSIFQTSMKRKLL